jgi:hypothetical protein
MHETLDTTNSTSPTLEKILSKLPIAWSGYAESEEFYLNRLHILIRLLVAGGSLPSYDFATVSAFDADEYDHEIYGKEWDTINAFETKYFPNKVSPKHAKYTTEFSLTYNPIT